MSVPEPSTLAHFGDGLWCLGALRRDKINPLAAPADGAALARDRLW
jgi:hypothetical protein